MTSRYDRDIQVRHIKRRNLLNTKWSIYAHDKKDTDWSDDSYKLVWVMKTIEDFWVFFSTVTDFTRHQFYIMRGDIPPKYECKENINGGSWSFLIKRNNAVKRSFEYTVAKLICEKLTDKHLWKQITGVYMTPRTDGAIVKVWITNKEKKVNIYLDEVPELTGKRFRAHNK